MIDATKMMEQFEAQDSRIAELERLLDTERELTASAERRARNLREKLVFELMDRTRAEGQWTPQTEQWARNVAGLTEAQVDPQYACYHGFPETDKT